MMVLHPELLSSYAMPYALISSLALVGLDLPKIAMGNPTIAKFVSIVIMVLNGVAQTMVISSNVDLTLSDATLSATAGRSIPGQFILAFLAAVGGALALDGLGIQKAEWKFALPPGLQEIGGPAGVVFRTLAGATALYMVRRFIAVNATITRFS